MSPVVVKDHSVVFSDSQQPPAQRLREGGREVQLASPQTCYGNSEGVWGSHLIVDLKLLDHPQLDEHPQSGRDHGVNVQGEIVKGELVNAQLTDQGDVSGLLGHRWRGREWGGGGHTKVRRAFERSGDGVLMLS